METGENRLHWADYLVTVCTLFVSLAIGCFFAFFKGGQKTKEEYLLGSRKMRLGPVCLSLFVTFVSAISLIGIPADVYSTGTMAMYISCVGIAFSYFVGYFTVVPLLHPLRLTSVYRYLDLRFHSPVLRLSITCIGMLQTMMYQAVALLTPALALEAVAGIPLWVSLVLVGGIGTIYTAIGGFRSVVWTDVFQLTIVVVGISAVFVKALLYVGGFTKMAEIAADGGRLTFDEVDPRERHSIWSTTIGVGFMWMIKFFEQATVQRLNSLPTLKDARRLYLLNVPLSIAYGGIMCVIGILLYSYVVTTGCDPYAAGLITNRNQLMPYFVIHVLSDLPGFAGLFMSMLFSGTLSTFSSGINALAANTVEDLLARPLKRLNDRTVTLIAKVFAGLYGIIAIGLAYCIRTAQGPVTQIGFSILGACGSPVLGVFFLAAGFPRSNKYGAGGGVAVGLAVGLWIAIGSRLYGTPFRSLSPGPVDGCYIANTSAGIFNSTTVAPWIPIDAGNTTTVSSFERQGAFSVYDISYLWFAMIGFVTTMVSGVVISCVTGYVLSGGSSELKPVDPKLIFPFCRRLYRLPEPAPDSFSSLAKQSYSPIEKSSETKKKETYVFECHDA